MSAKNNFVSAPTLVVAAVIERPGTNGLEVLSCKRKSGESGAGLWEFPGGKVEIGESERAALKREILEELGLEVMVLEQLTAHLHQYPGALIDLRVYRCQLVEANSNPQITLVDHDEHRWVDQNTAPQLRWSAADLPVLPLLWPGLR